MKLSPGVCVDFELDAKFVESKLLMQHRYCVDYPHHLQRNGIDVFSRISVPCFLSAYCLHVARLLTVMTFRILERTVLLPVVVLPTAIACIISR